MKKDWYIRYISPGRGATCHEQQRCWGVFEWLRETSNRADSLHAMFSVVQCSPWCTLPPPHHFLRSLPAHPQNVSTQKPLSVGSYLVVCEWMSECMSDCCILSLYVTFSTDNCPPAISVPTWHFTQWDVWKFSLAYSTRLVDRNLLSMVKCWKPKNNGDRF